MMNLSFINDSVDKLTNSINEYNGKGIIDPNLGADRSVSLLFDSSFVTESEINKIKEKLKLCIDNKKNHRAKKITVDYLQKICRKERENGDYIKAQIHSGLLKEFNSVRSNKFLDKLSEKSLYDKRYKDAIHSLHEIKNQLNELSKNHQNVSDSELKELHSKLNNLYTSFTGFLDVYDKSLKIDLLFAYYFGQVYKEFKSINDLFDKYLTENTHHHNFCPGCQFMEKENTTSIGPKNNPYKVLNNRTVDVFSHKKKLEDKIKDLNEKISNSTNLKERKALREDKAVFQKELDEITKLENPDILAKESDLFGKSIMVVTCSYGTGHKMVASAITESLKKEGAHVSVSDFSTDVLLEQNFIYKCGKALGIKSPFKKNTPFSGVDAFNLILKKQLYAGV